MIFIVVVSNEGFDVSLQYMKIVLRYF